MLNKNVVIHKYGLSIVSGIIVLAFIYNHLLWNLVQPILIRQKIITHNESTQNNATKAALGQPSLTSSRPHMLRYRQLGIEAPLITIQNANPLINADWNSINTGLDQGVGLVYEGESVHYAPLIYIIGHSSSQNPLQPYSSVFAALGQAKVGDTLDLQLSETYHYTVREMKKIHYKDTQAFLQLIPKNAHAQRVVLVTCWPLFTSTQYRLVVIGERTISQ